MTKRGERKANRLWDQLLSSTISAISSGCKHIVFWGFNENCARVLSGLRVRGWDSLVTGIVDHRPFAVGCRIGKAEVRSARDVSSLPLDCLVITLDREKADALLAFSRIDKRLPRVVMAGVEHLDFMDAAYERIRESLLVNSRAAGYPLMSTHLFQAIKYVAGRGLVGDVAEFGVYKGGTAVFLARMIQHFGLGSRVLAFDTFYGFPTRSNFLDLYEDPHDAFCEYDEVSRYCAGHRIQLIRGDIRDTYKILDGTPLVLSFFDTDNYSPALAALPTVFEQTVHGGVIAFDHYHCEERWAYTIGEWIAADQFFRDRNVFHLQGTGVFVKV